MSDFVSSGWALYVSIISILLSLLLPAVQQTREAARITQCQNHLRQIGIALHGYHEVHQTLPMGSSRFQPNPGPARITG